MTLAAIAEDSGARLITQAELLANATDVDGPSLTAISLAISSGNGTLVDNGNGTWSYTPALNDDTSVTFSYAVTDGIAAPVATSATLDITPVNDAPVADLNGGAGGDDAIAAFTEDGGPVLIAPAGTIADVDDANIESLTATLTSRPDGDGAESLSLNAAATAAAAGLTVSYTAATGVLSISGTASLATYQTIVQGIQYDNTEQDPTTTDRTVNVVVSDGDTTSAVNTSTITVAALNDAPVISGDDVTTTVKEDQIIVRSGHFDATDVDNDALTWSVVGGSSTNADYFFRIDDLNIIKNGAAFFHDTFGDGVPPPSAPNFANGNSTFYFVSSGSTFFESAGRAVMLGPTAFAPIESLAGGFNIVGHSAILSSNVDPNNLVLGLKSNDDFTVEARFDLVMPDDPREAYGIRLTDRIGDPVPGAHDNDVLGLLVRRSEDDQKVEVVLQRSDFLAGTVTIYERYELNVDPSVDQIVLRLTHDDANPGVIHASFDLYDNGNLVFTHNFATAETIFHGENWTRAEIHASAPVENVSVYTSDYGVLTVDQDGNWQYVLRNGQPIMQQLAEGETHVDHFTVQVSDGNGRTATKDIDVTVTGSNDNPSLTGDLTASVVQGGAIKINDTALGLPPDIVAEDPDTPASERIYTVDATDHGHIVVSSDPNNLSSNQSDWNQPFSQADLDAGHVFFVHDGADPAQNALFTVTLSDGVAGSIPVTATVTLFVSSVRINVLTDSGYDFDADSPIEKMGLGAIQPGGTSTEFTIFYDAPGGDAAADRSFVFTGNFTYLDGVPTGFFTRITEKDGTGTLLAEFLFGANVAAVETWLPAVVASAQGDDSLIEALSATWNFNVFGMNGDDRFGSGALQDSFTGRAGNDAFDGGGDFDRANYTAATGPITVNLAAGTVQGTGANGSSVGTDTLQSIELVGGTAFNDIYIATGFNSQSANAGSTVRFNVAGTFNRFEGRGGDDTIVGNDDTQISYIHAFAGVTVDLDVGVADGSNPLFQAGTIIGRAFGTAPGDVARVGTDTFSHVSRVIGSYHDDILIGSDNPGGTTQTFEGRGGNDFINGNGGIDAAAYNSDPADEFGNGIDVHLWLGTDTVTGGFYVGRDDLRGIEGILGTEFNDSYDAHLFGTAGFTDPNVNNVGNSGTFNFFEGRGGDDTVTGNFGTRVQYTNASAGVTVILGANGSGALASGLVGSAATAHFDLLSFVDADPAGVGIDIFNSGVSAIRGSQFGDFLQGNGGINVLDGQGGNDLLRGLDGGDTLTGGTGADIFAYTNPTQAGGADVITDFNRGSGVFDPNEGDRVDLTPFTTITGADLSFLVQAGSNTVITFLGTGNTLTLQNTDKNSLTAKDFIFAGQVAITVQSPDGYDFSTLYDDMAAAAQETYHDASSRFVAVMPDSAPGMNDGRIFVLTSSTAAPFTYGAGDVPSGGSVFSITIYDTSYNMLVSSRGWNISLPTLVSEIGVYAADHNQTAGLDAIFNAARYSIVGSAGAQSEDGTTHLGADVFFGGIQADIFNGLGDPFGGPSDPGNDTVDYSHVSGPAGVTANLASPASNTGAATGDTYLSIENLRGSAFNDALTGDANNNLLEGGPGNDTLDGGDGIDTASYEHAPAGVTVSLAIVGSQNTGGAGDDTLSNFENLRGSTSEDTLTGNSSANVLDGFGGEDVLTGLAGADTFVFRSGVTTITDFDQGNNQGTFDHSEGDRIDVSNLNGGNGFNDFAELEALFTEQGGNTIINFGNGNSVTLFGVQIAQLQASDFILH